jgi:hypothetical protein
MRLELAVNTRGAWVEALVWYPHRSENFQFRVSWLGISLMRRA